jgi:hypothetical protein
VPTCSNHGRCIEGECHCERGWKGPACIERKNNYISFITPYFKFIYIPIADCLDPSCSLHGSCVSGRCFCKAGWQGEDCSVVDQQVYQCLPGCSDHGQYDLETGSCVCDRHWTGPDCSQAVCSLECGSHGICESGRCRCHAGWTGPLCEQLACDPRCAAHGQCKNGTCVCSQGWNGKYCTLRKLLSLRYLQHTITDMYHLLQLVVKMDVLVMANVHWKMVNTIAIVSRVGQELTVQFLWKLIVMTTLITIIVSIPI